MPGLFYWNPLWVGVKSAQDARNGVDKGRQGPGRVMGITKGAFLPASHLTQSMAEGPRAASRPGPCPSLTRWAYGGQ
jgi:hypothetical protein